jgi:hypothetical protein
MGNGGVAGFLTSLLGGLQAQNQNRQQMQANQANLDAFKSQQAQMQLKTLGSLYKQHPELETDPNEIKRVDALTKIANLPNAVSMQPGQVSGQDLNAPTNGAGSQINIQQPQGQGQGGAQQPVVTTGNFGTSDTTNTLQRAPQGQQQQPQVSDAQRQAAQQQLTQLMAQMRQNPKLAQDPNMVAQGHRLQGIVSSPQQGQGQQQGQQPQGQQPQQSPQMPGPPQSPPTQQPPVSATQRTAAQQQLSQIAMSVKKNPRLQTPQLAAQVKQLQSVVNSPRPSDQFNAPQPGQTREQAQQQAQGLQSAGTPMIGGQFVSTNFGQMGMPRETIDPTMFAPGKSFYDYDDKTKENWLKLRQGPTRDAAMSGVPDVPDSFRTTHSVVSPAEQKIIYGDLTTLSINVGKGIIKGADAATALQAIGERAADAGIDVGPMVENMQHDMATGPEVTARIAQYYANVTDKNARAAYVKLQTEELPAKAAAAILQGQQRADAATTTAGAAQTRAGAYAGGYLSVAEQNAQSRSVTANANAQAVMINAQAHSRSADASMMNVQNKINNSDLNGTRTATAALNTNIGILRKDLGDITKQIVNAPLSGLDIDAPSATIPAHVDAQGNMVPEAPGPSISAQATNLRTQLDTAIQQQTTAKNFISGGPSRTVQQSTGNPTAFVSDPNDPTGGGRYQVFYQNGRAVGRQDLGSLPIMGSGGSSGSSGSSGGNTGSAGSTGSSTSGNAPPSTELVSRYQSSDRAGQAKIMQDPNLSIPDRTYLSKLPRNDAQGKSAQEMQSVINNPRARAQISDDPAVGQSYLTSRGFTSAQAAHIVNSIVRKPVPTAPAPSATGAPAANRPGAGLAGSMAQPQAPQGQAPQGQPGQPQGQQNQRPANEWAGVDSIRANASGDAGTWLSNTLGAVGRQMGFSGVGPNGQTPAAPPATRRDQTPEVQGAMAKEALPVVTSDLAKGIPAKYIVAALMQHGLTQENASKLVIQARMQSQPQQPQNNAWGANNANSPFGR